MTRVRKLTPKRRILQQIRYTRSNVHHGQKHERCCFAQIAILWNTGLCRNLQIRTVKTFLKIFQQFPVDISMGFILVKLHTKNCVFFSFKCRVSWWVPLFHRYLLPLSLPHSLVPLFHSNLLPLSLPHTLVPLFHSNLLPLSLPHTLEPKFTFGVICMQFQCFRFLMAQLAASPSSSVTVTV